MHSIGWRAPQHGSFCFYVSLPASPSRPQQQRFAQGPGLNLVLFSHLISSEKWNYSKVAGSPVIVQILNLYLPLTSGLNFRLFYQQLQLHLGLLPSNQVETPYSWPLPVFQLAADTHSGTLRQFYGLGQLHNSSEEKNSDSCWAGLPWVAKPR